MDVVKFLNEYLEFFEYLDDKHCVIRLIGTLDMPELKSKLAEMGFKSTDKPEDGITYISYYDQGQIEKFLRIIQEHEEKGGKGE